MRNKTHFWQRSLAALLSFVMLLGMVPAFDIVPEAEAYTHTDANTDTQGTDYISLPITIRDFPADGMLFENNEYGSSGTITAASSSTGTSINVLLNPTSMGNSVTAGDVTGADYTVFAFVTEPEYNPPYTHQWWKTIYVNPNGTINRVVEAGVADADTSIPVGGFLIGYHSDNTYDTSFFGVITEANKENYIFKLDKEDPLYGDATLTRYTVTESELTGTFNYANNAGFGLLHTDASTHGDITLDPSAVSGTAYSNTIQGTTMMMNGSYSDSSVTTTQTMGLNSGANETLYGGWIRTNLVESSLDGNKNLVYTEPTVTFLANYMQAALEEDWQASDGSYNLWYVMGDKLFNDNNEYVGKGNAAATRDLAAVLRSQITGLGSYTDAQNDYRAGNLSTIQDIDSYYDAAYFLLHKTFDDVEGYGLHVPQYSEIRLVQKTKTDGTTYYTFNSAFDDTKYDPENGYIVNTQTTTVTDRSGSDTTEAWTRGNIQALNRFDPLGPSGLGAGNELGYGMSGSIYKDYYAALGASNDAVYDHEDGYYENTNYNLSLEGHGQFVYYEDDNLYFTFTGDDDVYLFINGARVLDLGGAHAISKATINLNDVATLCNLVDGHAYDFDFYYMERHGTAANFGIETNIKIAEPSMTTSKIGYQNQANTGYNGWVDPSLPVGYSFDLANNSNSPIYNLTFNDPTIGVFFGYDENISTSFGYAAGGVILNDDSDISKMYMYLYNPDGTVKERYLAGSVTEELIRTKLKDGLLAGEKIGIYGFKYDVTKANKWQKNTEDPTASDTFLNVVYTTATATKTITANTTVLHGMAEWKVQKASLPFTPFHVYDWVARKVDKNTNPGWYSPEGAGVTVDQAKLVEYFITAKNLPENYFDGMTLETVLCSASGHETGTNLNPNAVLNSDGSITYTSTKPGLDTVFYKIKGTGLENGLYDNFVFNYDVYTYGAADNVYVLDYGLSVELAGADFGFQVNDTLSLPQNKYATTAEIKLDENSFTSNYGTFTYSGLTNPTSVKYTPNKIINDTDSFSVNIQILETGATNVTKYTGVNMTETVTTAPATVVYYEDNFPGITYLYSCTFKADVFGFLLDENDEQIRDMNRCRVKINSQGYLVNELGKQVLTAENEPIKADEKGNLVTDTGKLVILDSILTAEPVLLENQWVQYETVDEDGKSVAGTEQSADQNSNYGSDPNYAEEEQGVWNNAVEVTGSTTFQLDTSDLDALQAAGISALNSYLGLSGTDSNGTVKELVVKETTEVMYFDFVGTGFEIVSRTTADQYALINVEVRKDSDGDGNYETVVKRQPVITESKGGDLYQVPIISITGMTKAQYRVSVTAAASSATKERVLYIDGIRIYGPLGDEKAMEYYNPEEYRAEFFEVKQLIQDGQMIYADVTEYIYDGMPQIELVTGVTYIENVEETSTLIAADDVTQYMTYGPNNELYLDGSMAASMIAFFVTPVEDYPESARTLEIGAHRKVVDTINGYALMTYSSDAQDIIDRQDMFYAGEVSTENTYAISSGTEMYYTIDVSKLTQDDQGRYLVLISAIGGENFSEILALTNIKVAGYEIALAEADVQAASEQGDLFKSPAVAGTYAAIAGRMALLQREPEVEEIPVNENLKINSAVLRASQVVSGRVANMTVKASAEAVKIVVTDADGNEVTATRCTSTTRSGVVTYTFIWTVSGARGQKLDYTIRVYDANGLASVNTETVTVTIK